MQAEVVGGTHYVTLTGELDLLDAPQVYETLVEIASSPVVVDLCRLSFVDATGVSALIAAGERIARGGNRLVLRSPQPQVRRVFGLLGLLELLE